jgi:hypothetical protein
MREQPYNNVGAVRYFGDLNEEMMVQSTRTWSTQYLGPGEDSMENEAEYPVLSGEAVGRDEPLF